MDTPQNTGPVKATQPREMSEEGQQNNAHHDQNDEDESPEAIKTFLISQRDLLKKSNNGPIDDKYLGAEM